MKIPEKPIDWKKTLENEGNNVFKLIQDKSLFKKIIEFNKRYLYWDELKYRVKDKTEQKYIWTLIKFIRSEKFEDMPFSHKKIKYVNLPMVNKFLHRIDKFLAGNIEVQSKNLGLQKKYVISSLMEEAIASSMIEGAATTRKAAKRMLKQKLRPKDISEQMVLNGYETMQMIVKRKDEALTPDFLLEIQTAITKETLKEPKDVGNFRNNDEIVVGDDTKAELIYHVPPSHTKIKKMIKELCDFANNDCDDEFIHPVIKGIALHFLIGFIHPFNDGNGRTARSIFYWYVLSRGYWLFEYMAVSRRILRSKKGYGLAYLFTEFDEFDLTYFIKYNLEAIDDSLNDLLEYIKSKQKEQEETRKIIQKINKINYRQADILEDMMKNPDKTFTIQEISETYRVVYQTARTDLLTLHKMGYAKMYKISKKFVFQFDEKNRPDLED
ncbi:MAG: Fic family protein [Candidatus Woesearchaeota archaeon]